MNKVAIITDLHFGIHKNNENFLDSQKRFFYDEFIPYLEQNNIERIFILGDIFDNRNSINVRINNEVYDLFNCLNKKFKIDVILGNHDTYYQTSNSVNSLKFIKNFNNVDLIEEITTKSILGKKCLFIPWQVNNDFLKQEFNADFCFGHFDIIGFNLDKNRTSDKGLDSDYFYKQFKYTFSGHYHIRSIKGKNNKIIYLGCPYHLDRNDIDEKKGFLIFDFDKLEYEFVNSKNTIKYLQVNYPDELNLEQLQNNIIDVYFNYEKYFKSNNFEEYLKKLNENKPLLVNVKIVNNYIKDNLDKDEVKIKSISELIEDYINSLKINNKDIIKLIFDSLYDECKNSII